MDTKLEKIKYETAISHGWKDYEEICEMFRKGVISQFSFDDYFDDVVQIYSE